MAIVLDAFVPSFLQTLTTMAKDEAILALGVGEEVDMLRERLDRILPLLPDAELHRFESRAVDCWLKQLRDVMYDAEDVVDECRRQGEKLGLARSTTSSPSSSNVATSMLRLCYSPLSCFSVYGSRHQCGSKMKSIVRRVDSVLKDVSPLSLASTPPPRDRRSSNYMLMSAKRSPTAVKFDIVGKRIEDDTRMLVDLLLSKEHYMQQHKKISVFAILGIGGIGKTTLAQKIYNDEKLRANFCQVSPIWVCVSQALSTTDLLRTIVVRAGGNPGDAKEKKDLEQMLSETIKGKKFFLVLDDVRDDRVWDDILGMALQSGLGESRILVTTPHEAVAKRMGAVHFHQVERMSSEDGWLLLSKMAFLDDGDARDTQNALWSTGIRIADRCDGVPLALKAIAGVLRAKGKRRNEWEEVLRNPAWSLTLTEIPEGVLRALLLSYMELPSHLKQCFLYFALFPKDAELLRNRFVHLWIAEGFVEATGNWLMEELAEGYWKELVQRNLLQPNPNWYDSQMCTMHDMVHSLARLVASRECSYKNLQEFNGREAGSPPSCLTKPRRLYVENGGLQAISDAVKEHASLRALISPRAVKFPDDATTKLRCLRVLNLQQSVIDELPRSVGDLVHLRYLNLSNSTIRELPESIGSLVNLQFLNLYGCRKLLSLPKCIVTMRKLRYINVYGTLLESMPAGIERLQRLVFLNGFIVSPSEGDGEGRPEGKEDRRRLLVRSNEEGRSNLAELGSFSQLRYLYVYKLERASGGDEARAAALNAKAHLTNLWLCCTTSGRGNVQEPPHYEEEEMRRVEKVFEELLPPPCLDYLKIGDYFGLQYPTWMTATPSLFLPNLRRLDLVNCKLCARLPPLGLLPQLEHLRIRGAAAVTSVGPELFGVGSGDAKRAQPHSSFAKLKELVLQNMPNWEEWRWLKKEEDVRHKSSLLPCLSLMILEECPKLRSLPKRLLLHAGSLKELQIKGAESLTEVSHLLSVEVLDLEYNSLLQRVSNLPSLKKLRVTVCGQLKDVDRVGALRDVSLKDPDMESLPVWLLARRELQLRSLRKLEIRGSNRLLSRCVVKGQEWDKIKRIPCVDAYNVEDESTYIHYTKSPFSFVTNLSNTARSG